MTAQQALFDTAALARGQTVLIHAGAGGVGHFAVQLAKARRAQVIATASGANVEFLTKLGTDVVVDYKAQKFEDFAKDVDVVLDSMGGDTLPRPYACLKAGGFVVSIVAPPDAAQLKERGTRGKLILVKPDGKQLGELAALIETHRSTPTVSRVFTLADVAQAHAEGETGHTRGKLVLNVR